MQQTHLIYDLYQALKKEDETLALDKFHGFLEGVVFDRESGLHYALIRKSLPEDDSQYVRYFAIFDKEFNFLEYQPVDGALQEFGAEAFYLDWQDAYEEAKLSINYIGSHKVLVTRQFFTGNSPITYAIYNLETKELFTVAYTHLALMNYVWEALLLAEESGVKEEQVVFVQASAINPYLETAFEDLNLKGLENACVPVNPLYRFGPVFSALIGEQFDRFSASRGFLIDVLFHFLAQMDLMDGMSRLEYHRKFKMCIRDR